MDEEEDARVLSLMGLRGMECNAPSGHARACYWLNVSVGLTSSGISVLGLSGQVPSEDKTLLISLAREMVKRIEVQFPGIVDYQGRPFFSRSSEALSSRSKIPNLQGLPKEYSRCYLFQFTA